MLLRKPLSPLLRTLTPLVYVTLCVLTAANAAHSAESTSATSPETQWSRQLLSSGRVEQVAGPIASANKATAASVDESMIDKVRKSLPSLHQFGDSLKYGNAAVVSERGPEVIALIRSTPVRTGADRAQLLRKLIAYSRQGIPEAVNFIGFIHEYGLFGAQRDPVTAREHYYLAASQRYQPALFNLANMAYFGKGQAQDPSAARDFVMQAAAIGTEASSRVCGLASFVEYRRGDSESALRMGRFCASPLSNVPKAAYDKQLALETQLAMLRDSAMAGIPDAYPMMEALTQQAGPRRDFLYCKYWLINRLRTAPGQADAQSLARDCYARSGFKVTDQEATNVVRGIASFAFTEHRILEQRRRTDRTHLSWSVPFLPFRAGDVNLFEAVMKEAKR